MKNSEFSHLALTARKSIEEAEHKWAMETIAMVEEEMVKKIRATPREKEWRVPVNRDLGQYTYPAAYRILSRHRINRTDLELIFETNRDKPDYLYFKFKLENER